MTSLLREDFLGTDSDDVLIGNDAISVMLGEEGDDVLVGAQGQDYLNGGDGNDILIGGGLRSDFWNANTSLEENIIYEIFYFDEPAPSFFAELLVGGKGDDLIIGGSWDDVNDDGEYLYADASAFAEFITDGGGPATAEPDDGGPRFGDDNDSSATDMRFAAGFNNIVWAGEGTDTVFGADGYDTIGGGAGDDLLYGLESADVIFGGAGDDIIYGGDGEALSLHREAGDPLVISQKLYGGAGNDSVHGGDDNDMVSGGAGFDILYGRGGDDTILGGSGFDMVYGGDGADQIDGGDDGDQLYGGNGDDTISGGEGGDILQTGGGDNILTGGAGEDYFFVESGGMNIITDFDLEEDILLFIDVEQQAVADALVDSADTATVNGVSGLMIELTGSSSVFLAGITAADKDSLEASANAPVSLFDG